RFLQRSVFGSDSVDSTVSLVPADVAQVVWGMGDHGILPVTEIQSPVRADYPVSRPKIRISRIIFRNYPGRCFRMGRKSGIVSGEKQVAHLFTFHHAPFFVLQLVPFYSLEADYIVHQEIILVLLRKML